MCEHDNYYQLGVLYKIEVHVLFLQVSSGIHAIAIVPWSGWNPADRQRPREEMHRFAHPSGSIPLVAASFSVGWGLHAANWPGHFAVHGVLQDGSASTAIVRSVWNRYDAWMVVVNTFT
jgi:hypothetical protein